MKIHPYAYAGIDYGKGPIPTVGKPEDKPYGNDILHEIMRIVSACTGIELVDIRSRSRQREIVYARAIYFYLSRKYTSYSLSAISRLAKRDHATALHAMRTHPVRLRYSDYKLPYMACADRLQDYLLFKKDYL